MEQRIVKVAEHNRVGVTTFYVPSTTKIDVTYVVKFIRRTGQRRWFCLCGDFIHRKQIEKRHCLHARAMASLVAQLGGIRKTVEAVRGGGVFVNVGRKSV